MKKLMPLVALLVLLVGCAHHTEAPPAADTTPPATKPAEPMQTAYVPEEPEPIPTPPAEPPVQTAELPGPTASLPAEETEPPVEETEPPVEETPELEEEPDEESVLAAYRQAVEACRWFYAESMPCDPESGREVDGRVYYRVEYSGIHTMDGLRGYLKSLFSDELVDGLLAAGQEQYVELDGVLYVLPGARGDDITKGAESRQVLRDRPGRLLVQVTVEVLDPEQNFAVVGSETYDFPYEKVGEQWIFTSFSLVR